MTGMRLGPPTLAGLQHIVANLRARDEAEMAMLSSPGWRDRLAERLWASWSYCLRAHIASAGDEPVAIVMLQWNTPRALQAALLATERWQEIARPLARHCLKTLKPLVISHDIVRVECRTWEGHADARGFLALMGARPECRLPGYGRGGEAFIQYAWTRPDLMEGSHVQVAQGAAASAHHH